MADETPEQMVSATDIGQIIAKGIADGMAAGMAANKSKKVSYGEYVKRPHSTFHPNGPATSLTRPSFQNGTPLNEDTLFDEEIALLNRIVRSGRYLDRQVEVTVRDEGGADSLFIKHPGATIDARVEFKGVAKDFLHLVRQIVDEQDAILELEAEEKATRVPKSRPFGDTKAYRAALEKAKTDR